MQEKMMRLIIELLFLDLIEDPSRLLKWESTLSCKRILSSRLSALVQEPQPLMFSASCARVVGHDLNVQKRMETKKQVKESMKKMSRVLQQKQVS